MTQCFFPSILYNIAPAATVLADGLLLRAVALAALGALAALIWLGFRVPVTGKARR